MTYVRSQRIAVIIPSLSGKTERLENALLDQVSPPDEICVVKGVRPNGRARNRGFLATSAEILIFIDDDAFPGTKDLLEKLVEPLLVDPSVGVTGTARCLPQDASWFQRRVALEIPRMVNIVPREPRDTNPPLKGYGHSLITTTCCATRRQVYIEAGGFNQDLISGVDTDFFYRVRQLGYRFSMVPDTFVEHPSPAHLKDLLRKFYWYGLGYSQEAILRPEHGIGPRLQTPWRRLAFILAATLWVVPNIFLLYSFSYPRWEFGFRPLKALSTYAVAWGYVQGWQNYARNGLSGSKLRT